MRMFGETGEVVISDESRRNPFGKDVDDAFVSQLALQSVLGLLGSSIGLTQGAHGFTGKMRFIHKKVSY